MGLCTQWVSGSWAALGLSALLFLGCGSTPGANSQDDAGSGGNPDGGTGPQTDGGSVAPPGPTPVETLVSQSLFEQLFLHRGTAPCQGAFYTYQSFVDAAKAFPDFAQQGTLDDRKRELAAFFANASHETTGGWATAPDGQYAWGLCWINEGGAVPQTADYCVASTDYPCAAGKKYYGRGPLQISYNYNYGQAGKALGASLLAQPELVASDPVLAWKTALWFWMTTQQPKPSCHDVVTGRWTPSTSDLAAGRKPGFGMTINIINGGVECNQPTPAQVTDRIGFYNRYSQILGVAPGSNLTCDKMQNY